MKIPIPKSKITVPQLKYLDSLMDRLPCFRTFKVNQMPAMLNRKVYYFADLTKEEASIVINWIKRELGDSEE